MSDDSRGALPVCFAPVSLSDHPSDCPSIVPQKVCAISSSQSFQVVNLKFCYRHTEDFAGDFIQTKLQHLQQAFVFIWVECVGGS